MRTASIEDQAAALAFRFAPLPGASSVADGGPRIVKLSIASAAPVDRGDFVEVLAMEAAAVDLRRASVGLPLLREHDPSRVIGIVEGVRLEGGRLVGEARFGVSAEAAAAWADIEAGVLRFVSVGYRIHATKNDAGNVVRVTKWEPYEASIVGIAADPSVGVGRSFPGDISMTTKNTTTIAKPAATNEAEGDSARAAEIWRIAAAFRNSAPNVMALAAKAVEEGASVAEFRGRMLDDMAGAPSPFVMNGARALDWGGRTDQAQVAGFSLFRAVNALVSGDWTKAGLERDVSNTLAREFGREAKGVFVPPFALAERTLTTDPGSGGSLVGEMTDSTYIDVLREQSVIMRLGARLFGGLEGRVSIPRQTATATAEWIAEGEDVAMSAAGFGAVTLNPKTVGAVTSFSRILAKSTYLPIEQVLRHDLRELIARALDQAALGASADVHAPTGLPDVPGVQTVEHGANGGPITWASAVSFVTKLEAANAAVGRLGWALSPEVKGYAMTTPKVAGDATMMMADHAAFVGYPAVASMSMRGRPKGTGTGLRGAIFANWSDLLVGQWGGVDIMVDPYSLATSGGTQLVALADYDIAARRPESFVVCTDIVAAA
jgi:HK97 family phage major capsid protein